MADPSVVAIMLTANRPEMARQAIDCFRRQTYPNRKLFVFDTGAIAARGKQGTSDESWRWEESQGRTIGRLRNSAIDWARDAVGESDIIVHWDDDDWSHPERISEQVKLLQETGAEVVGYNEMLFARGPQMCGCTVGKFGAHYLSCPAGRVEAWLYHNTNPCYALGTSLCYWRAAWSRRPFADRNEGEDLEFITGRQCSAVPAFADRRWDTVVGVETLSGPRMVARIHSGNTSVTYRPEAMARAREWKRVPEWDRECRGVFA